MDLRSTSTSRLDWSEDTLAIGVFESEVELTGDLVTLDQKLAGVLKELITEMEFKGKAGSSVVSRVGGGQSIRKLILLGMGQPETLTLNGLRQAAASAARLATKEKSHVLGLSLPLWQNEAALTAGAIVEGLVLALHQDHRFKSETDDSDTPLRRVAILGLGEQDAAISQAQQICEGVILARELVAAPANVVTPSKLAETAEQLAQECGLELEILEAADCEKLSMGAFLGVSYASDLPPKFIHLTYKPDGVPRRKLALIGKGVTFDSGGLNIKMTGSGIEMMKTDMGGAAAVLGAAKVLGHLKPDVELHFITAATENMINGRAMRPGDILTASNGKTIEVNNTDAEGRLTLADALVFAEKLGVDAIVDLATLTGACVVALGDDIAGLWSSNDALAGELVHAAEVTGEKVWRMPLEEKYIDKIKSPIADLKNAGGRAGGAITGALFLKEFVKETAWAHLDVAGPVWADKEESYNSAGATGYGVRLLVNWALMDAAGIGSAETGTKTVGSA